MGASRRGVVLRWAVLVILVLGASISTRDAAAQLYSTIHRPSGIGYYRFQTPHLQLIYQDRLFGEAREIADVLERVYPEVRSAVGLRRSLDVPVILNHYTDRANGFVSPWPFRQEIEAVNLRGLTLSPRFPSWFETVGPHELTHAAHAESGHGFGFGWILRQIGPDLARSLNLSGPRGINEGMAVWLESQLYPGAGRLNYSLFEMEFRAAMLSENPWSLVQMLEPPAYTRPFDRYYNGGGHLFEYLADEQGIDFFHRTRNFYYRFPLLGYAPAVWYGTGMMPHLLGRRIRRHSRAEAVEFVARLGELTQAERVVSVEGGVFRRPRWLHGETLVAYGSGYSLRPGFYRIDAATGKRELIAHEAITEDAYFSLSRDRTHVYFSRYVPATFTPAQSIAEIFRLDVASGEVRRLTDGGRAYGAVEGKGEGEGEGEGEADVWVLGNVTQFNEWKRLVRGETRKEEVVGSLERTVLVAIEPSPDGERVALVANHRGRQGIYEAVLRDGKLVDVIPWVVPADASVFDASWSPDGGYVVFSADPGGVANIYALEVGSGHIKRLTNVAFGAIEPSVSLGGAWLAYVNYRHERYEIVRIPFSPEVASPDGITGGDAGALELIEKGMGADLKLHTGGTVEAIEDVAPGTADDVVPGGTDDAAPGAADGAAPGTADDAEPNSADGGAPGAVADVAPDAAGVAGVGEGATAQARRFAGPFSPKRYRALAQVRPRVLYPFVVYQRKAEDREDVSLGFGAGAGVEWADPLKMWTAHTSGYYQHGTFWGRVAMQSGHTIARPSVDVFRSPLTVSVLMRQGNGPVDTVRVGRDERGIGVSVQTPVVVRSNVFQTHGHVSLRAEYRQERLFGRENETLREADERLTMNPTVQFVYRGQQNPRDLVPNSGVFVTATSKVDLWAERGRGARWIRVDGRLHIPLLQRKNTGVQLQGRMLTQNRGGVVDLGTFFPRGYETVDAFLGEGTFVTYGVEVTQPLWYVDDGFFLIPLYVKTIFAYGFAESMQGFGSSSSMDRLSVAGAGLGVQLRFAHSFDFTVRVAPVYKFARGEWDWTTR